MSAYTEEFLVEKLSKLVNTQESIQTLSEWVKFHKKNCEKSVEVWDRELYKAPKERKLVFLYLANDIMQTSRKRGGEFIREFSKVLSRAIQHVQREGDKDDKKAVSRLLSIWKERKVLSAEFIDGITKSLSGVAVSVNQLSAHVPAELDAPPVSPPNRNDPLSALMRTVAGREVEIALAEEKVQSIRPQLMSGEALLTCANQAEVTELAIELDEAISVFGSFQKSLEEDVKTKGKLLESLKKYMESQQQQKEATQKKLQECTKELTKTEALKEQLKHLYEKLPPGPLNEESEQTPILPSDPRVHSPQKRAPFSEDASSPGKRTKYAPNQSPLSSPPIHSIPTHSSISPIPTPIPAPLPSNHTYYTPDPILTDNLNSFSNLIFPPSSVHSPTQNNYINQNLNNMTLHNGHQQLPNNNGLQLPLQNGSQPINDYNQNNNVYLGNDQYSQQMANFQYGYIKPVQ